MDYWMVFKSFFIDLVRYGFPTVAIIISIISFIDSRKAKRIQSRLYNVEEKLKKYELEEKEKEREDATKACVEARIINISKNNYKLKIWNSGKATAYNVDFKIPEESEANVLREKVPYEYLESSKSFEEHIIVHMGTANKFVVTTTWADKQGISYSKEQIVTV